LSSFLLFSSQTLGNIVSPRFSARLPLCSPWSFGACALQEVACLPDLPFRIRDPKMPICSNSFGRAVREKCRRTRVLVRMIHEFMTFEVRKSRQLARMVTQSHTARRHKTRTSKRTKRAPSAHKLSDRYRPQLSADKTSSRAITPTRCSARSTKQQP